MDVITFPETSVNHQWLSILLHGVISLPDVTLYDKQSYKEGNFYSIEVMSKLAK